jgi:hypothetical protein
MPATSVKVTNKRAMEVFASVQGFFRYDSNGNDTTAHTPFLHYTNLNSLYHDIDTKIGKTHSNCSP